MTEKEISDISGEKAEEVTDTGKPIFGMNPMKVLFAMEYVLQGLANPFQGITYQSFFRHFRIDYGISEGMTQSFFSQSYLAWSFKPLIGFLMDAYGKTKVTLIFLLILGGGFYFTTPFFDTSASRFFWLMFALAVVFASTDVAVDRATVIEGEEESKSSGKSKAATVGLNQSICWGAIYGTGIIAAATGGWIAEHIQVKYLLFCLAVVPIVVFIVVLHLPKDKASSIPLKESVINFWNGLNSGSILWIILFYFLFHFQPALGALWTNHLMVNLHFTQTQIGISDGISYLGNFCGVLIFIYLGIKWQDKIGLRNIFKIFIILSILVNLTQYLLVDPWFSRITGGLHNIFSFSSEENVRLIYLSVYNFFYATLVGLIRMSTFSLVGAAIPSNAAGSLFAGFMSVANLAYSFSYSSGSWLYEKGFNYSIFRFLEKYLFSHSAGPGEKMSVSLLIFIGSMAYLLSFITVQMLPDKKETLKADSEEGEDVSEKYKILDNRLLFGVNVISIIVGFILFVCLYLLFRDIVKSMLISFFIITLSRKLFLDWRYCQYIKINQ